MTRRCNNVAEHLLGMLCWGDPGHTGPHHSRHGDYQWHNPPVIVIRHRWFRRERWQRMGVPHPYGDGSVWLWNYEDPRGRLHSALKEMRRALPA